MELLQGVNDLYFCENATEKVVAAICSCEAPGFVIIHE